MLLGVGKLALRVLKPRLEDCECRLAEYLRKLTLVLAQLRADALRDGRDAIVGSPLRAFATDDLIGEIPVLGTKYRLIVEGVSVPSLIFVVVSGSRIALSTRLKGCHRAGREAGRRTVRTRAAVRATARHRSSSLRAGCDFAGAWRRSARLFGGGDLVPASAPAPAAAPRRPARGVTLIGRPFQAMGPNWGYTT